MNEDNHILTIRPIAYARNGFSQKFGIPRQSREESVLLTRIVFEPEYRVREALRGIEGFSHLWLVWGFSENRPAENWSPTVRPPRLGGNTREGVFATRSPYRPNPLGLSSVRLLRVEETAFEFEELLLLSRIMYAEAGSVWLSDEWKMCVGEVVLNRVASPEFPDTIREVLEQPGQYYGKNCRYFDTLQPSELCVRLALRLLLGERVMDEPSVVFQANFRQGGGVFAEYRDAALGSTYFCYSIHPELY